jgi:hypothetical protein
MPKLRVHCFAISVDGYGAGPDQSLDSPLGVGGMALHEWIVGTRTFKKMLDEESGATGVDDDFAARGFEGLGAAGLVDEMHLAIAPVLPGSGEHLLAGLDLPRLGYRLSEHVSSPAAIHVIASKQTPRAERRGRAR